MAAFTVNTAPPVPADPLVQPETGVVSQVWYKFFVALWQRTGATSGTTSAVLDQIGNVRGGMLARFATQWLEFVATNPNSIPVLNVNSDPDLLTLSQLLDTLGTVAIGNIIYRDNAGWKVLTPVANRFLMSQGIGNPVVWTLPPASPTQPVTTGTGLVATGTNQATAFPLTRQWSVFSTVAAGTGAILQNIQTGLDTRIWNDGANALKIYPPVGGQIDALGTNNPYSLPTVKTQIISKLSPLSFRTQQLG